MNTDRVPDLLREACAAFSVPGAQLGLVKGADRWVFCYGTRDLVSGSVVTPGTPFHAGSIAKSLTALVVLEAARRGVLELDVSCGEQAAGLWPETPRALMAQVTGRPNLLPDPDESLDSFVARVASLPRVHEPGRFSYCNAGWPVLDLLLRRRTGAGFEQLASQWVLGEGAIFGEPDDAARGHAVAADDPPRAVPGDAAAAASAAGARWWVTADQLLDFARLHLDDGAGRLRAEDVRELRRPHAAVPGATMADSWGLGWALWDRGRHRAFGWAGYTGGHRAYLRCFPEQDAALVLLTNSAGPLFGPPGGSAAFDLLLPDLLSVLGVPPLVAPRLAGARDATTLAGGFGPVSLLARSNDGLLMDAAAFGEPEPLPFVRSSGNTFVREGEPPGGMNIAIDGDLLYVGPFALPRTS